MYATALAFATDHCLSYLRLTATLIATDSPDMHFGFVFTGYSGSVNGVYLIYNRVILVYPGGSSIIISHNCGKKSFFMMNS